MEAATVATVLGDPAASSQHLFFIEFLPYLNYNLCLYFGILNSSILTIRFNATSI